MDDVVAKPPDDAIHHEHDATNDAKHDVLDVEHEEDAFRVRDDEDEGLLLIKQRLLTTIFFYL